MSSFRDYEEFRKRVKVAHFVNPMTEAMSLDIVSDENSSKIMNEHLADISPLLLQSGESASPFEFPDESIDGLLRFAVTENGKPVGINPEECHVLIAGQTNTGKSTLLKIIFAQALLLNKKQEERQDDGENNLLAAGQGPGHEEPA